MALIAAFGGSPGEESGLWPTARMQVRYTARPEQRPSNEVSIRRARLTFDHALRVPLRYKVQLGLAPHDLGLPKGPLQSPVLDAFVDLGRNRWATLRIGKGKLPLSRERMVSSARLQLVDRSLANGELDPNRDVGVALHSEDLGGWGWLRYSVGTYIGQGRTLRSPSELSPITVVRVDLTPLGPFGVAEHTHLQRRETPKLSLGVAHLYQPAARLGSGTRGAPLPAIATQHTADVDAILQWRGLSIVGEALGRRTVGAESTEPSRDAVGGFAQVGWLLPRIDVQLVSRFGELRPWGASRVVAERELGGGVNVYFRSPRMRVQVDVIRTWRADRTRPFDVARLQLDVSI